MGMLGQMVQLPAMQQMMGEMVGGPGGSSRAQRDPTGGQVGSRRGQGDALGGMDLGQVMQQMMPMVSQVCILTMPMDTHHMQVWLYSS